MAARISASLHRSNQHALYIASLAPGAPPLAVPSPIPKKLALETMAPAIVDAMWVPWPSLSRADRKKLPIAVGGCEILATYTFSCESFRNGT
nr:uncharacterized protein A4U43_C07F38070 [Ipomoea batatas]